jgi:hypothetical protein
MFHRGTGNQLTILEFLEHEFARGREFVNSVKSLTPYLNDGELPLLAGKLETAALGQALDIETKQPQGQELLGLVPYLDEYLHAGDALRKCVVEKYGYANNAPIDVSEQATTGQSTWPPDGMPPWGGGKPPWEAGQK